ncbi:hypothetical protein HNY73_005659 [Argiope bruennichi]|uniref:Uncharacterized protein n=1 Tax=Argiope bruennichi TaxID=94029 RepID=A0A8T0FJN6_ARGBR|nr:hypothetical protein HNY73_005659 [Argiope bruennichi]
MGHLEKDINYDVEATPASLCATLLMCSTVYFEAIAIARVFQLFDSKFNIGSKMVKENTIISVDDFGWRAIFSPEFPAVASYWTNQNTRSLDFSIFHEFAKCRKHFKGPQSRIYRNRIPAQKQISNQ